MLLTNELIITLLNYAGVAVFAAAGALAASRKQLDIIGFIFLANVTGMGGGTFRDLILGVPVFWVVDSGFVVVCATVAVVVFFSAHRVESRYKLLLWLDALGLAAFCVIGAGKGLELTGSPTIAIVMGMLSATFGGVLRDILTNEPSVLLTPELYVAAALSGATLFTLGTLVHLPISASYAAGSIIAFSVRGGALRFGWVLRPYRSRPGRRPEDIP